MGLNKKNLETLQKFKESRDYRDITYFTKRISNIKILKSILEDLGYRIGIDIIKSQVNPINTCQIGKKGEIRMQISNRIPCEKYVLCAII